MSGTVKMGAVARAAGVSQSAVSKVLNGRPGVSEATRVKVLRTCEELGYEFHARSTRRSTTIELISDEISSEVNTLLFTGLHTALTALGYHVSLVGVDTSNPGWVSELVARRPSGAVLITHPFPPDIAARLTEARIPAVAIDMIGDAPDGLPAVGSTQWRGGYLAGQHVAELGHERIAMITGPMAMACSRARLSGARAALAEHGVDLDDELVTWTTFAAPAAQEEAARLLARPDRPTAILTGNDLQALGVLDATYDLRLRVPDDLSVVGYDDQALAQSASPPLTTVHQPLQAMAAEAGRIVVGLIRGEAAGPVKLDIATTLTIRRSTAPPPQE